jgi:hypothetical protein
MALRFIFEKRFGGVTFKSGRIYNFSYVGYAHDPAPLAIFLYWLEGTHPRTKRQWRFMQCINLHYLNRGYRKEFVKTWVETLYNTRNLKLTWKLVKQKFPEIAFATRRYFHSPKYYMRSIREIPLKDIENEVVGSLMKDFSNQTRITFWTQARKLQRAIPNILGARKTRGKI